MDFIEEFDLALSLWTQDGVIPFIENISPDTLYELVETLFLSIKYHLSPSFAIKKNKNFSFVANSSLSGKPYPCSDLNCRLNKLDNLVSFASLYADTIYINNPFEFLYHSWENLNLEFIKNEIANAIYQYFYLKPFISLGIISYSCSYVTLCEHHHETLAAPLYQKIRSKEKKLRKIFREHLLSSCTTTFNKFNNGGDSLKLKTIQESSNMEEHIFTLTQNQNQSF